MWKSMKIYKSTFINIYQHLALIPNIYFIYTLCDVPFNIVHGEIGTISIMPMPVIQFNLIDANTVLVKFRDMISNQFLLNH